MRRRAALKLQQTVKKPFVGARLLHQQRHVFFQFVDVVARARHVPLYQRNRAAHRVRYADLFNHRGVADKKIGMAQQIVEHRVVIERRQRLLLFSSLTHK